MPLFVFSSGNPRVSSEDNVSIVFKEQDSDKCSLCNKKLIENDLECRELLKCSENTTHLFHCECAFIYYVIDHKCPCCKTDWEGLIRSLFKDFIEKSNVDIRKRKILLEKVGETNLIALLNDMDYSATEIKVLHDKLRKVNSNELALIVRKFNYFSVISNMKDDEFTDFLVNGKLFGDISRFIFVRATPDFINSLTNNQLVKILERCAYCQDFTLNFKVEYIRRFLENFSNQLSESEIYSLVHVFIDNSLSKCIGYLKNQQKDKWDIDYIIKIIALLVHKDEKDLMAIDQLFQLILNQRRFRGDDLIFIIESFKVYGNETVKLHDSIELFYKNVDLTHLTEVDINEIINLYRNENYNNLEAFLSAISLKNYGNLGILVSTISGYPRMILNTLYGLLS